MYFFHILDLQGVNYLRLDKYLKVSRIIKRRPVAKEACDLGKVKVNGKLAKAGDNIEINDEVEVEFRDSILKIRVLEIKEHVRKEDSKNMYEIINN